MRAIATGTLLSVAPLPVLAEVCDKVRPRWNPADGKVNELEEVYFFFTSYVGIGLLVVIFGTIYFRKLWLSILVSILLSIVAALLIAGWFWLGDGIPAAAYQEGCRASPLVTSIALVLIAFCLIQHARPRVTQRLNTVNLGDDLDDVEMLEAVENICGIKIEDAEAEKLVTVGDLYDLVNKKLRSNSEFDPIWELVCQITREYSGSRDPIDKNTTFFPKFAKKRD